MRLARTATALLAAALAAHLLVPPGIAAAGEAEAKPTGLARFTTHPRFLGAKISPRGTHLAALVARGGRRALVFIELTSRKVVGGYNPAGVSTVGRFFWSSDDRVVVELEDDDGTEARPVNRGEIYAVNADGRGGRMIFGYRVGGGSGGTGTHIKVAEPEHAWGRVVDTLRDDDRFILVASTSMREEGDRRVTVWRLDTLTGLKQQVAIGPLPDCTILTDEDGTIRLAAGWDASSRPRWYLREQDGWRELPQAAGIPDAGEPLAYRQRARAIYVVAPHEGGFGLFAVPLDGGELQLVTRTEIAPPDGVLWDRATGRVLAVASEPDLPAWDLLEPTHPLVKALDGLLAANPGKRVSVLSLTEDDRLAVVEISSDRDPGQYLLLDVAKLSAEPLVAVRPWIDPAGMAETQAFHLAASDGFRIHGYLTLPPASQGTKPPLVVLPHGGPHGVRDAWGFDPEAQLLASEGFAVLQVNYRGSGGYGEAFEAAGYRRWGDRVVQDVLDAARWAVKKGKVDGERICTMGTSFGAYAAMQAAILAPDLVRCAVGIAGVYDLTLMEGTGDISWRGSGRAYVRKAVGQDPAALRAASPVFNAQRLTAPVFLAHGGRDERTPISHAEKLRDALTALGRPPAWLAERTEGHGFFDEGARQRLAVQVVAFLKKHTAPKAAAPVAPPAPKP